MSQLIVTPSLDGHVGLANGNSTWHNVVTGAGTIASYASRYDNILKVYSDTLTENFWDELCRGVMLFNTAGLPDDAVIISAALSLYITHKYDNGGFAPDLCLYPVTPASDVALVAADFSTFGTTELSDKLTYAGMTKDAWNAFTLNAAGLAAVSKTGMSRFGIRNASYDVADELDPGNHNPIWASGGKQAYIFCFFRSEAGYSPYLTIDYTTSGGVATGTGAHKAARMFQRM
jgi:hypothetical protein